MKITAIEVQFIEKSQDNEEEIRMNLIVKGVMGH